MTPEERDKKYSEEAKRRVRPCNYCGVRYGEAHDSDCRHATKMTDQDHCAECGIYTPHLSNVETCIDHLDGLQAVTEYAEGLRECRDKQIEEIRSLNAKIDGGVETVKERDREIEKLEGGNKSLAEFILNQNATINRLLAEKYGLIGGK